MLIVWTLIALVFAAVYLILRWDRERYAKLSAAERREEDELTEEMRIW